MHNEYNANQILDYEAELNALQFPAGQLSTGEGWRREDDRYENCVSVWRHDSGDEIIVYLGGDAGPNHRRYRVLTKSGKSGALTPVKPFPSSAEAEAFVQGMLVSLSE